MGIKVALNGFGRIGRNITRAIIQNRDIELIGINDVQNWEILAYLLEFDSVQPTQPMDIKLEKDILYINSKPIKIYNQQNQKMLDFGECDVVIESSGKFLTTAELSHHLDNGAKKVIISAPANDDTPTFVLGANTKNYNGEKIISNASCTTNAIAPICKVLDENFIIESGILTTIHAYTNDQNLLDNAHRSEKRRSRAAAMNIIPTTTGSAKALYRVLPNLKGKLHGHSVRVPVADVSMVDLSVKLSKKTTKEKINELFAQLAKTELNGIIDIDIKHRVSSDFIGNPNSATLIEDMTFLINNNHLKLMAWYDNEWGYANRIIDMAKTICG